MVSQEQADKRQNYKRLFFEIIDNVSGILQKQSLDLKDFDFLDLVNLHCLINWKNSDTYFMERRYDTFFKPSLFEQQLFFVYRDSDYHKANSQELLDYIKNLHLQSCFSEVFNLLFLIATYSRPSSSVERPFSWV